MRGISFDWNELYGSLGRSTEHREIGIVAQELKSVFPELVTSWGDKDNRAVDYGRFTAVLLEDIKELKAENDALKQRVEALENSGHQEIQNVAFKFNGRFNHLKSIKLMRKHTQGGQVGTFPGQGSVIAVIDLHKLD